jgi:hypothetical protein
MSQVEFLWVVTSCCVVLGYQRFRVSFRWGVKRSGREADHSPPSSAEVNEWSYTSTPPIRLHGVVLSQKKRHRDNFTLPFNNVSEVHAWRQRGPLKRRHPATTLHGVTTQKNSNLHGRENLKSLKVRPCSFSDLSL